MTADSPADTTSPAVTDRRYSYFEYGRLWMIDSAR